MGVRAAFAIFLSAGAMSLGGCMGPIDRPPTEAPMSESCDRACNSEYDACMDRFEGLPDTHRLDRPDDPNNMQGPNGVCPDQLKSCLKRCSL